MPTQTDLIFIAAALEQGLRVYRVSQHTASPKEQLALSFLPFNDGELVVCANGSQDYFCRRVVVEVHDYDLDEIAGIGTFVVQSAELAYRTFTAWAQMRGAAKRKITTSAARAAARQMLADTGIDASQLLELPKAGE